MPAATKIRRIATPGQGKTAVLINSIARLIDVGGATAPVSEMDEAQATQQDWQQVGDDLRAAIGTFEAENEANLSLPFDELGETP